MASQSPLVIVLMGVSGCGKSTTGVALSQRLGWPFRDADSFHPPANVEKMRGGTGFDLDEAAVRDVAREVFARTLRAPPFHFACQANIASTITPKTAKATQEEPVACTRTFDCPARNCMGCVCTPRGRLTSTCVSSFKPARGSSCETTQRASWRVLISSASVNF